MLLILVEVSVEVQTAGTELSEGFATLQKSVRDFEIPRFRVRFLDFRWDFKISGELSQ